ncbi:MAG: MarR family winged helix-turn-helix transcriptional regulator [Christensenellales bacterium]
MLDEYSKLVNTTFNDIYEAIQRVEQQMLKSTKLDLSISELNILETIRKANCKGCSVSEIARAQNVTLPTITVAIKRLEAKGYVEKVRSQEDGRMVSIRLSRQGEKADAAHRYFHEQMIRAFLKDVGQKDRVVVLSALKNLSAFLNQV